MMLGRTFLMEFLKGWKGFTLFLIIVLLTAGGFPQFFTAVQQSEELEGAENIKLEMDETIIDLSWKIDPKVSEYRVIEDNTSYMITPEVIYQGTENHTQIDHDFNETRFYAVIGVVNETQKGKLIGLASTSKGESPFDELMESDFYRSFTGGRQMSMTDIKGFISIEFFSWWFLLAGLYIGYITVSTVSRDFEEKRMDILFSTPMARHQYLLEKYAALAVYSLIIVLLAGGIMIGSVASIGYGSDINSTYLMLAVLGSWPILLVVEAVAMLCTVYLVNSRSAMGMTFLFAFSQYAIQIVANIASKYEYLNNYGILGYWDYNEALLDYAFTYGDFILLIIVAMVILLLAVITFNKKDIPA